MCGRKSRKTQPKITVKYSAARLHEKGVILDIEGLPHSQYVSTSRRLLTYSCDDQCQCRHGYVDVTAGQASVRHVEICSSDLHRLCYRDPTHRDVIPEKEELFELTDCVESVQPCFCCAVSPV